MRTPSEIRDEIQQMALRNLETTFQMAHRAVELGIVRLYDWTLEKLMVDGKR